MNVSYSEWVQVMHSTVSLLYQDPLGISELNIIKIVEFLGGTVRTVKLTGETVRHPDRLKALVTPGGCLITGAQTLASLRKAWGGRLGWQPGLADLGAKILVYGFESTPGNVELLRELTAGALVAIELSPATNRQIDVAQAPICR